MRCYFSLLSYPYVRAAFFIENNEIRIQKKQIKHKLTFIFPHKNAVHTNLIRIQLHFILFRIKCYKQITQDYFASTHTVQLLN